MIKVGALVGEEVVSTHVQINLKDNVSQPVVPADFQEVEVKEDHPVLMTLVSESVEKSSQLKKEVDVPEVVLPEKNSTPDVSITPAVNIELEIVPPVATVDHRPIAVPVGPTTGAELGNPYVDAKSAICLVV